jgi:hypothetical protein
LQGGGRLYLPSGIIRWLWFSLSGGSVRGTYLLSMIFLNQSIVSLGHAGARCFIRRSSVSPEMAWVRTDGRRITDDPALLQQGKADIALCHADLDDESST